MASNDYHFISHWRVRGTVEEVFDILTRGDLSVWWPSVYLKVTTLKKGRRDGIGREFRLYTKGWLPYTLHWDFVVSEVRAPNHLRLEAMGDFTGRGIWTLAQDGEWVHVTYDWQIEAQKPLLRFASFAMKPVFSANHHWAMEKGEESLRLELERRHASTPEERALIPPPPGPTPSLSPGMTVAILAGVVGLVLGVRWLARR